VLVSAASALILTTSVAMADPAEPSGAAPQTAMSDSAALAPGAAAGEHQASLISTPGWTAIAAVAIVALILVAVSASENNTTVTTH
jgi:hypothetical protein